MEIVQKVLELVTSLISLLLKPFSPDNSFVQLLDNTFSFVISTIKTIGWIVPLDVLVICLTVSFAFDNWALIAKFVKWIASFIRG